MPDLNDTQAALQSARCEINRMGDVISQLVACVDMLLPGAGGIALSGDDIMLLNEALIEARPIAQQPRLADSD